MPKSIDHLRASDKKLAVIIDAVGPCRIHKMEPNLHSLVRSIVYQQLSGKVASVIFSRLTGAVCDPVDPDAILSLTDDQTRAIGLSRQKASYIRDLAARMHEIDFPALPRLRDQQVIERLTQVKGVGVWTAHMFLIFAMRRPNVLPTGDLGIRMAMRKLYKLKELPTPKEMERIAASWHPYCSTASWYLWRSLELPAKEKG